jgi:2-polyprenyl-3-methyl-5-hydroxy-6-metoxy-1,4-benzoquinol methylase
MTDETATPNAVDPHNEWDDHAADWDHDEAARAYAAAAFQSLRAVLERHAVSLEAARVVDFGCGTGLLTELLVAGGAVVDAVDTSSAMIEVVDRKIDERGWTTVRTSTDLAVVTELHDLIVCSSVCSFLVDYPATVRRLVSLLRPGGLFVQWDWERDDTDDSAHGLTRAEITSALRAAGLEGIDVDTAFASTVGGETMRPLMGQGRRPSHAAEPRR